MSCVDVCTKARCDDVALPLRRSGKTKLKREDRNRKLNFIHRVTTGSGVKIAIQKDFVFYCSTLVNLMKRESETLNIPQPHQASNKTKTKASEKQNVRRRKPVQRGDNDMRFHRFSLLCVSICWVLL